MRTNHASANLADHYEYFGGAWREVAAHVETPAGDGFTVKFPSGSTLEVPVWVFSRLLRCATAPKLISHHQAGHA